MQERTERIARNTIFLYIRTFFTMLISLYTSRVVLRILGVEDYGIYNVVGGISASFAFLSAALSNATHRYLSYEIGCNNETRLNQIFSQNLIIYSLYALISFLLIELGGRWLVCYKLNIPLERINAAMWVLHSTSVTLCITILSSVYESVLVSRENMKMYAYIGVYDSIIKLVLVFTISVISYDKLILYSILITIAISSSKIFLYLYAKRKYLETSFKFYWNGATFKEIFKFSGWNLFDAFVFLLNDQGINMLLNIFFGPTINAARGISLQVKSAVLNFSSGFLTAMRPQIVKSYSSGDIIYFRSLVYNCGKYSFFLLYMLSLPIIMRIQPILNFWLGDVPSMTAQFVIWMLVFNLINSLCDPFWQGIQAVGDLKWYVLLGNSVYILVFPISYIALKLGGSPVITFQIVAIIRLIYLAVVLLVFNRYVKINFVEYVTRVLIPIVKVMTVSLMSTALVSYLITDISILCVLLTCVINVIIIILAIVLFGMNVNERSILIDKIKSTLIK